MGLLVPYKYRLAGMDSCQGRVSSMPTKSYVLAVASAATNGKLATRDGMNHQDFVLLARNFLDAFTGCHVKWLRAGLGLIFGNHLVHFPHVGSCWIVFEKCRIAVG